MTTPGDRGVARPGAWWRLGPFVEPATFQVAFTIFYALDAGFRVLFGYRFGLLSGPGLGAVAAGVLLVVALVVPWERLDPRLSLVLPVADIAVVGVTRLSPEGGNGMLLVFPALWLGRTWGRIGVWTTGVATLLLVTVPALLYSAPDPILMGRAVFFPLVAGAAALVIADGMERVRLGRAEAERQRDRLAEALETIDHQQRVSQAIFDTTDVGLILLGRSGEYAGMNRRHREFLELAFPEGHRGRAGQLGNVFAADARTPLEMEDMPSYRASQGEEFDDVRMWVGDDPAERRALSVSARTVRAEDGSFAGAALAYHDVTDFMRALRVKDEFVALVSHELRTPLTSIVGYVQILEEDETLTPRAQDQLQVVHRNAERLRRLIADLLDTAQRDGRPMPINRTTADLAAIVVESVEAARPAADRAGVGLTLSAPDRLSLGLDPQRIAQVVDNLVSNAVKYTEDGGHVAVRLSVDADRAEIEVTDTGIGISAPDRERLFTRFFRTADAASRAVAGAGLGLSITKDIVESHGGRIEVESEPGRGSVFRVRLPLQA
ncbi:ATP-binding protein [Nocardioides sp. YIM 152315]|uniref:sensor histidine kinase n=1 Tax=Nocardioides sp. YIM 152315 TaxID=3031760 RepID=UPI0023DA83E3|nr:ATP-binding protein [Nocardioides sp. YIM 152315]MDF1603845.1 ATP-binding protein [Nocardioides sp. YIM 152315]